MHRAASYRGAVVVMFDARILENSSALPDIGPVRVPVPLASIVGRESETGELCSLVTRPEVRLVTITGPGGVGKTRLALEVVRRLRTTFTTGHYYIQMDALDHAGQVVPVILQVLRHYHAQGATTVEELASALEHTPVLLVLNTIDRMVDARASVARLLEQLPTVKVLGTSRVPFRVRGEQEYPLDALPLPAMQMPLEQLKRVPSVALFLERAKAVRPTFDVHAQNVDDILEVLRRLEGLPYAIELMALRSRLMPVRAMRDRRDHLLDFLEGGPPDLPQRLRSVRNAIQWGYDLLTPHQQKVARALSVFGGPFGFDAARQILASSRDAPSVAGMMDDLSVLVDHHVLIPLAIPNGDAGYRMTATMRAFHREKLVEEGERDDMLERELALYVDRVESSMPWFYGDRQKELLASLDMHVSNLHDALITARQDNARSEASLRLATLLTPYWVLRGMVGDGAGLLGTFLERATGVSDAHLANAWHAMGSLYAELCQLDQARDAHQRALALYESIGDLEGATDSRAQLGAVAMKMGDLETASALISQALEARRASNDNGRLAASLSQRGDLAMYGGDPALAAEMYARAYRLHMDIGNLRAAVCDCVNLLTVPVAQDDSLPFEEWYRIGTRFAGDLGDQQALAQLRLANGILLLRQEVSTEALQEIHLALPVILASESRRLMLDSLPLVAEACVRLDDDRMAAQVLGAASRARTGTQRFTWYRGREHVRGLETGLRERLGDDEYMRYTALGTYLAIDQTIQAVVELIESALRVAVPRKVTQRERPRTPDIQLTGRETQVLGLVTQGLSDKDIAKQLGISPRTAMTHMSNIMAKMKVHSRSAAAEHGIRMGLVGPPRET